MNIATLLGLNPVKPFVSSKATPLACADPSLLMGIELEIEGIKCDPSELYVPGLYGEADNSLRETDGGRGWEFITKPATFSVLAYVLGMFFGKAKLSQENNYSERCSVHVHANVQDLEPSQLKSITLLYQVMERVFYGYAGNDRDMNIFCVPWAETTITHSLVEKILDVNIKSLRQWQKYTGLNLIPVTTQGTIEFRHLPGTCDLPRILGWLNMIGCLFAAARKHSYEEIEKLLTGVNTTSDYRGLLKFVFGQWEALVDLPNIEQLLEEGALNTKYILLSSAKSSAKGIFNDTQVVHPFQWVAQQYDPAPVRQRFANLAQRLEAEQRLYEDAAPPLPAQGFDEVRAMEERQQAMEERQQAADRQRRDAEFLAAVQRQRNAVRPR